jgi:hypothetical protein
MGITFIMAAFNPNADLRVCINMHLFCMCNFQWLLSDILQFAVTVFMLITICRGHINVHYNFP